MAEDDGAPEAGLFARAGLEVVERQRIAKELAGQGVCSWIVQNQMKYVLGRMIANAT